MVFYGIRNQNYGFGFSRYYETVSFVGDGFDNWKKHVMVRHARKLVAKDPQHSPQLIDCRTIETTIRAIIHLQIASAQK